MKGYLGNRLNGWLDALAANISNGERRRSFLAKCWGKLKLLFRLSALAYLSLLLVLWLSFRYCGEQNLTTAFLLYLPPAIWALPLVPILALALLIDWKTFFLAGIAGSLLLVGLAGWSLNIQDSIKVSPNPATLTVFTFNRGQSQGATQRPFIHEVNPDVLIFQDAPARGKQVLNSPGYETFKHADSIGEFTLVSRFPVLSKSLIEHEKKGIIARFTIDWNGRETAIYSVHFRTPRDQLLAMRRGAFVLGILGLPGTSWAGKRQQYERFWHGQIESAELLLEACRREKLPYLVAGDFNVPPQGFVHHLLTKELVDSHEETGWGGGYTFPGKTHNPLALRSPWLRLDKILCSHDWKVLWSTVEPEQPSQHRAVAASFVYQE